jgi:hypothetical protein
MYVMYVLVCMCLHVSQPFFAARGSTRKRERDAALVWLTYAGLSLCLLLLLEALHWQCDLVICFSTEYLTRALSVHVFCSCLLVE